ncbi:4-hydroxy-tetrahydrodipicolinate synthase [bacterium]|nr:MAG: 4-hydroxy-tetrahydrodipicolinate synthase [bacterium]
MVTPFAADGSVDLSEAQRIAAYLVDVQKNDGLVVNGTTGESPTVKENEKFALLEAVLEAVGDRAAVLFGAGTYSTEESIHFTKAAEARGAHGIMLVNPYYNRPGQAGLYAHFSTVSAETGLPVLLYNIQPRSAINLETSTLLRLAEIENVVGVKEASGNVGQISDVCREAPEGFRVYSGDDGLTVPILSVGGYGIVSVTGHVVGARIKEMVTAFPTNPARAAQIHQELIPITKAMFSAPNPVPVKYALSRQGYGRPDVRLPLVPLSDAERAAIDVVLERDGILQPVA